MAFADQRIKNLLELQIPNLQTQIDENQHEFRLKIKEIIQANAILVSQDVIEKRFAAVKIQIDKALKEAERTTFVTKDEWNQQLKKCN